LPRSDEPGMIPAAEIMICNQPVKSCIRENRIFEIPNVIETSRALGMQSLDYSIQQLFRNGYITQETAVGHAMHPEKIERARVA
jgi:twitching motility protein PilT